VYHMGDVIQEGDDLENEAETRGGVAGLMVTHGRLVHFQSVGHLSAKQIQAKPSLPEMIAQSPWLRSMGWTRRDDG